MRFAGWRIEIRPQDAWIGVFWRLDEDLGDKPWQYDYLGAPEPPKRLDVWICVIPCVPLHLWWVEAAQ